MHRYNTMRLNSPQCLFVFSGMPCVTIVLKESGLGPQELTSAVYGWCCSVGFIKSGPSTCTGAVCSKVKRMERKWAPPSPRWWFLTRRRPSLSNGGVQVSWDLVLSERWIEREIDKYGKISDTRVKMSFLCDMTPDNVSRKTGKIRYPSSIWGHSALPEVSSHDAIGYFPQFPVHTPFCWLYSSSYSKSS